MFSRDQLGYQAIPLPDRQSLDDDQILERSKRFFETMKTRHSVRDFSDRPVARAVIENAIRTAGRAPSGANHQPWYFAAIARADVKHRIRLAAEAEEETFYAGGGGEEWLKALEPIGTNAHKPHLDMAPWLIVVFAQRYGEFDDGTRYKNYYVPQSVGIATGFLVTALHHAGLCCLIHTPNPMRFLNRLLDRPASKRAVMILAVGHPADDARIPAVARIKKPVDEIAAFYE